jgi:hypothetical protein
MECSGLQEEDWHDLVVWKQESKKQQQPLSHACECIYNFSAKNLSYN